MTLERATLRVYRTLIRAFPGEFREAHGADLAESTEDVVRETVRRYGRARLTFLIPRLLGDLLRQAAVEHWRDALRDSHHAIRLLARAPGFTAAAVLCLAVGTGLTAAMYAQVQSTILAELPGGARDPQSLIRIQKPVAFPAYEELRDGTERFARLAGYIAPVPITLETADHTNATASGVTWRPRTISTSSASSRPVDGCSGPKNASARARSSSLVTACGGAVSAPSRR